MRVRQIILLFSVLLALGTVARADSRHSSVSKKDRQAAALEFKRALDLQKAGQLEEALRAAGRACELFPGNPEYVTAREALRQQLVSRLLTQGNRLAEAGNLSGAQAQFRQALSIDPENTYVQQRLRDVMPTADPDRRRTLQMLASVDQIDLAPSPGPASIHTRGDTRSVYAQVGKLFGITFRVDDALASRQLRLDLDNVDFYTATQLIGKMSKTFWVPVSRQEAIVATDTPELRRQYERQSVRTFYVGYATTAAELNDIANILRNIFEMTVVAVSPTHNTITVKAPRASVEAAASMIDNLMDVRPEILLEVQEFEFDTDEARKYGLNLPNSFVLFNVYSEIRRVLGGDAQAIIDQLKKTGTINPTTIPVADLANLQSSPLLSSFLLFGKGLGLTGLVVSPIIANFSFNSSSTKTTEHVTLRALDGESATFRVGSRFPILTGSFSSLSLSANGRPAIASTPQFQYQDLGLTVKAKPHYQSGGEVRLDLEFDVVGLGAATVNNIPELTNRSYTGNITVMEGEPSVIMGAVTDQEARTTTGYPGIGQLPVLSAIISSNTRQRDHNQIVVVITPHLIRKPFHETGASTIWGLGR